MLPTSSPTRGAKLHLIGSPRGKLNAMRVWPGGHVSVGQAAGVALEVLVPLD